MPQDILKLIISVPVFLLVGFFAITSLLGIYIVTKYGRTPAITVLVSLAFAGVFFLMTLSILLTTSQIQS